MAEFLFKDGNLTIRAALYLNAVLIDLVMGFTAPVTVNFFMSHLTPEYIAACTVLFRLTSVVASFIKQSEVAIKYISQKFLKLMIACDISFFIVACIGEANPELRFLAYNMICICGIKLLTVVRKDNINNCLNKSAITTFNASCDTWALIASLIGASMLVVVTKFGTPNVTICMIVECIVCAMAHWCQLYANRRIKKLLYCDPKNYTLKEVINDVTSVRHKIKYKKNRDRSKDNSDVFDQ
jgi:hypothetical protein